MSAGSIVIDLVMKTGMFETDTKRAEKALQELGKKAKAVGTAIGVATAAAATALGVMVKQSIDAMDEMGKLSQSTGVAVEQLSALAYAGDLSDVSTEALGASLVKLTKGMSDAVQGTGEAQKAFAAMGLSVKDAEGNLKDGGRMLTEIAGKFATYRDGAEKTALALALFGRAGAAMIPMMNSGADGLAEMTDEARELGLELSEGTTKAAEAFNDNLTRLNAVKKGLVNRIAAELLPSLVHLSEKLLGSAKSAERLDSVARAAATGVKLLTTVGIVVAGVFKTLGEAIGGVAAALVQFVSGDFRSAFETVKNYQMDVVGNVTGTISTIRALWKEEAVAVKGDAKDTGGGLAAPALVAERLVKESVKRTVDEAARMYQRIEDAINALNAENAKFGMTDEQAMAYDFSAMGANSDQISRYQKELDIRSKNRADERAGSVLSDLELEIDALGMTNQQLATRNALLRAGVEAESEFGRQITDSVGQLYKQGDAIDQQIGIMDGLRGAARGFLDDLRAGENAWDALKNAANRFADVLFELAATKILDQLFGKQGEAGGGMFGDALGAMFGGGKASGGDVLPGRGYIVGEEGPEYFQPRTAGTILPAGQTAAAMAGGRRAVTQNITFPIEGKIDRRSRDQISRDMWRAGWHATRRQ
ncbi:MAG: hypothetical protein J0L89_08460 [Xanthomonadales bacterium]|nr:hypothetical protein [Xanthomonadales bacterium]